MEKFEIPEIDLIVNGLDDIICNSNNVGASQESDLDDQDVSSIL